MTPIKPSIFGDFNIDFKGWPKPLVKLIESVDKHIGRRTDATHIREVADAMKYAAIRAAEANEEVRKIEMKGKIDLALAERTLLRITEDNLRHQRNREAVVTIAAEELKQLPPGDVSDEPVDEDWMAQFFEYSQNISDEQMQSLWGRILAGEVAQPGSYSRRTINFLSTIDKSDAEVFSRLCSFGWFVGEVTPLIFNWDDEIYLKNGITFDRLQHLDEIGLITFGNNILTSFLLDNLPKTGRILYHGVPIVISLELAEVDHLSIGKVILSKTGKELAPISGAEPIPEFLDYTLRKWIEKNVVVFSEWPNNRDGAD